MTGVAVDCASCTTTACSVTGTARPGSLTARPISSPAVFGRSAGADRNPQISAARASSVPATSCCIESTAARPEADAEGSGRPTLIGASPSRLSSTAARSVPAGTVPAGTASTTGLLAIDGAVADRPAFAAHAEESGIHASAGGLPASTAAATSAGSTARTTVGQGPAGSAPTRSATVEAMSGDAAMVNSPSGRAQDAVPPAAPDPPAPAGDVPGLRADELPSEAAAELAVDGAAPAVAGPADGSSPELLRTTRVTVVATASSPTTTAAMTPTRRPERAGTGSALRCRPPPGDESGVGVVPEDRSSVRPPLRHGPRPERRRHATTRSGAGREVPRGVEPLRRRRDTCPARKSSRDGR